MTGVTRLPELVAARQGERPSFIACDLRGLFEPHPEPPPVHDGAAAMGGWQGRMSGTRLTVEGRGGADDWWRVAAVVAWAHLDAGDTAPDTRGLVPPDAHPEG
jgi:hypothetical protein